MPYEKKNVVVVMMDSLQWNYLGCYGNPWIQTPNIDRFAKEGVLFERNYIDNLPTIPCRRSMFTGCYSLHYQGWTPLQLEETTITDLCWGLPIDTALVFDCPMYRLPKFGYTRGFDKVWFVHGHQGDQQYYGQDPLYHLDPMNYLEQNVIEAAQKLHGQKMIGPLLDEISACLSRRQYWKTDEDHSVAQVMKTAVRYLEQIDRNKSFYLWVDSFDPHEPWDPPSVFDPDTTCPYDPDYEGKDMFLPVVGPVQGVYTEPQLNHIRMLYAEKVTMVDKWVGYLLHRVRSLGLEDSTLIMLVSDHGEPMGNGKHGHGIMRKARPWPYEELAHAPLLMKGPGIPAGRRISAFTQSCDVGATIADWLGIGVQPQMHGYSLLPLARGEAAKVRDFAVAGHHGRAWAIYTDDFSYVHWHSADVRAGKAVKRHSLGVRAHGADEPLSEAHRVYKEAATLDGLDQWTCTPGSIGEVPAIDELYDSEADPFQLNNIAARLPGRARELNDTLREFMAELRTS